MYFVNAQFRSLNQHDKKKKCTNGAISFPVYFIDQLCNNSERMQKGQRNKHS